MEITRLNVFVIIVTYNGKKWYDRCFQSINESSVPVKTIVVDNASSDGTYEYIKKNYPNITLIESQINLGFGQANNIGIRHALSQNCDYVFLLNQDTWIQSDTIYKLINCHLNNNEYGILSPIHLSSDETHFEPGLLDYLTNNSITDRSLWEDIFFNRVKEVYNSKYINAAAWLIPKNTLTTVGGFDPIYFHYAEDDDYLNRTIYHGLRIGIVPKARIVHDHRTDDHPITRAKQFYHHQQGLLVRFTNINTEESLQKYILYCLRKTIISILRRRHTLAQDYFNDIIFLCKNRKKISQSRIQNIKRSPSWLKD